MIHYEEIRDVTSSLGQKKLNDTLRELWIKTKDIDPKDLNARTTTMIDKKIRLMADTIDLSGYVTFSEYGDFKESVVTKDGLATPGTTIIDGGNITSGVITGRTVRTGSGSSRIELSGNTLKSYYSGKKRIELDYTNLNFYSASGVYAGGLHAGEYESSGGLDGQTVMLIDTDKMISILADKGTIGNYDTYAEVLITSIDDVLSRPGVTLSAGKNSTYVVDFGVQINPYNEPIGWFGSNRPVSGTHFSFNSKVTVGGRAEFIDQVYAYGNVSALSFTDRTPGYNGDALKELSFVSNDDKGNIDHTTLPQFARKKIKKKKDKNNMQTMSLEEEEEGRDLGAMISVLTVAIQQLTKITTKQEKEIKKLKGVV